MPKTYYGATPSDAARSEERDLDRSLNLGLSNRAYLAQQRAADNALSQNEYGLAQQNYFKNADLADKADTGDENRALRQAQMEEQQYQFDKSLEAAQADREAKYNALGLRNQSYLENKNKTDANNTFKTVVSGIHGGQIQNIDDLKNYADYLTPDAWEEALSALSNQQQKRQDSYNSVLANAQNANEPSNKHHQQI